MLIIRDGIQKMFVRIANREDPDQMQSDMGLRYLFMPFKVTNFRISTAIYMYVAMLIFIYCFSEISTIQVIVLIFQKLVACQTDLDKQCRTRSDCF